MLCGGFVSVWVACKCLIVRKNKDEGMGEPKPKGKRGNRKGDEGEGEVVGYGRRSGQEQGRGQKQR